MMRSAPDFLTDMIRRTVESMGYELVGVELLQNQKGGSLVRVYIDQEAGIGLDDCSKVSHQASGLLDVEDPIQGNYQLEVSSPGLDRPLFSKEHFERFRGNKVRLKLRTKVAGRRKIIGVLNGLDDENVLVVSEGEHLCLPLDLIETARLMPEF